MDTIVAKIKIFFIEHPFTDLIIGWQKICRLFIDFLKTGKTTLIAKLNAYAFILF
jgi:hypothetical protein